MLTIVLGLPVHVGAALAIDEAVYASTHGLFRLRGREIEDLHQVEACNLRSFRKYLVKRH